MLQKFPKKHQKIVKKRIRTQKLSKKMQTKIGQRIIPKSVKELS